MKRPAEDSSERKRRRPYLLILGLVGLGMASLTLTPACRPPANPIEFLYQEALAEPEIYDSAPSLDIEIFLAEDRPSVEARLRQKLGNAWTYKDFGPNGFHALQLDNYRPWVTVNSVEPGDEDAPAGAKTAVTFSRTTFPWNLLPP